MNLRDSYSLCCEHLGKVEGRILFETLSENSLSDVLTHPEKEVEVDFLPYIKRVLRGEPIQYVLGRTEFMSLEFLVNPSVLIPRQDTELLVEWAIETLKGIHEPKILDLCTGSGCVGISVAKYTNADVTMVDISKGAVETAKENARLNGVNAKVLEADALVYNEKRVFDMILSNPPYIATSVIETLENKVKNYEPRLALDGGKDGTDFYFAIAKNGFDMLKCGGFIGVEIGFDQGERVKNIFEGIYKNATVLKDLCGKDRVVISRKG